MNERNELYVLKQLAKLLNSEQKQLQLIQYLKLSCYVLSWLFIFVLSFLASRGTFNALPGVVLGALAGMLAGLGFYFSSALKQWPVLRQHMNKESVLSRLKELET